MKRAHTKVERLNKIQLLLSSVDSGLTRSELTRRIGVSKATISRDISELSLECPIIEDENNGKLFIDKISLLANLYLNVEEIQALHMACRLLGLKVRFNYPSASSALRKLGTALNHYAEPLASAIISTAELFESHNRREQFHYAETVKVITEGLMKGRSVQFERYSRKDECWKNCLFCSYCIEPYAAGNSLYLVGMEKESLEIRTIKFELIRNMKLTGVPYTIPHEFCSNNYFKDSWGIWTTTEDKQSVKLIFSPKVKERVLQTEWHSSENTDVLLDGRLIWYASIAEPLEMMPWIRGWGADVEVIEPVWLRELVIADIEASYSQYGLRMLSDFKNIN